MKYPRLFGLLTIAAIAWSNQVDARDVDERKWILMESQYYSAFSTENKKTTREILEHLEALRMLLDNPDAKAVKARPPLRILIFAKDDDYHSLGFSENTAGVFIPGFRDDYIVMIDTKHNDGREIIVHEYIHFLTRTSLQFPFPLWWNEGYAEYFGGSRIMGNTLELGLAGSRQYTLRYSDWIPWQQVLGARHGELDRAEDGQLFYAQSWLLVHFLLNSGNADKMYSYVWPRYRELMNEGLDQTAAMEGALGISIDDLAVLLMNYGRRGAFPWSNFSTESLLSEFSVTSRRLEKSEVQAELGRLAMHRSKWDAAAEWFEKSVAADRNNVEALAGLAGTLSRIGDTEAHTADELFEEAYALDQNNPLLIAEWVGHKLRLADQPVVGMQELQYIEEAESIARQARENSEESVELDTVLASLLLKSPNDADEALTLLQSVNERSKHPYPRYLLALAYTNTGRYSDAIEVAEGLVMSLHGNSSLAKSARDLVRQLVNLLDAD